MDQVGPKAASGLYHRPCSTKLALTLLNRLSIVRSDIHDPFRHFALKLNGIKTAGPLVQSYLVSIEAIWMPDAALS
jgi:hypothetical protein